MQGDQERARVVDVRSGKVFATSIIETNQLRELLDTGVQTLTGALSAEKAWRGILGSAERIVLKFNSVGAQTINTNGMLACVLVNALTDAGYDPEKIALVEAPEHVLSSMHTWKPAKGWGAAIPVGGEQEPLAAYLYDADAIINVPSLKTHQLAGMSGCLKNLSHALMKHPARYHANGCSPYVGQVVGSQEVSKKLRLNVMNALRVVIRNGPDAREEDIVPYGGLLVGFDPVAVDTAGLELLAVERRRLGLPGGIDVRYLTAAGEAGVGKWRTGQLERLTP